MHVWRIVWNNGISVPFHLCKQVPASSCAKQGINKTWQNKQSTIFRDHWGSLCFSAAEQFKTATTPTGRLKFSKYFRKHSKENIPAIFTFAVERFQSKRIAINFTTRYKHSDFLAIIKCVIKCSWDIWDMIFGRYSPHTSSLLSLRKGKTYIIVYVYSWCLLKISISCSLNIIRYGWKIYGCSPKNSKDRKREMKGAEIVRETLARFYNDASKIWTQGRFEF